jgi:uncharacterized caspase-like protein
MRILVGLILACFIVFAGPAHAQERRVALVIGVSSYEHAPALANPLNDAVDVAAALEGVGFEVVDAFDPDYAQLQTALRNFGRKLAGAQVGLVYFAGHGVQIDGRNYMLPRDAKLDDDGAIGSEAIDVAQALNILSQQPRVSLVILDACRDNPLAASLARRAGVARSLAVSQGLAQITATSPETLVAYSTQPGSIAIDGRGRNSPFTTALLRHIATPGLDVQELMRRVRASVMQSTNGVQVPWDNSSLTKSFAFAPGQAGRAPPSAETWTPPQRDPTPRQIDVALWNDVKDRSAGEIQTYLNRFPNGIFAETARARLAALSRAASADRDRARQMAQDIAKEFALIAGRGAIVEAPKEPQEFYANARLYELRGDFLNARRAYLGFFNFALPYVDPHYRFQTFLRVQEGRVGAREVYNELAAARRTDQTLQYAAALLAEADQRKAKLEEIIRARPDFAPAYFELARNYSEALLGSQTLSDKEREAQLLGEFVKLADGGKFLSWFIDQTLAAEQLDEARRRLAAYRATAVARAVTMNASRSNQGWMLSFSIAEAVQEIFVTLPGKAQESTGFLSNVDPRTGKPMARPFVELPGNAPAMNVQIRYRDSSGQMRGPFNVAFNPSAALDAGMRDMLNMTKTSWLSFRDYDGRRLLYFTSLLTGRCAIREVRYGLNTMTPSTIFTLPPCDSRDPYAVPSEATIYLETPLTTRFASVQLTFSDGTKSDVQRFEASQ